VLALIPARGQSQGIPQKALQPVNGKPLILHTIDTVREARVATRIVVTTDCPHIRGFCQLRGIDVLDRPAELAEPDVPLAPVIDQAAEALGWGGEVGVFQPTCPLLTAETVKYVVNEFRARGLSWAITGTADPHLYWGRGKGTERYPLTHRVNRQQLTSDALLVRESGAIQLMMSAHSQGTRRGIILIDAGQGLDVDTPGDLALARHTAEAKTIRFTVAIGRRIGSGHFWRCLQLADSLTLNGHNVFWDWHESHNVPMWARTLLIGRPLIQRAVRVDTDLEIYDVLHANRSRVLRARAGGARVVVFEDDGPAALEADLAINEMVDGPEWAVLRPEFSCLPEHVVRTGRRVLVTFGGTDPSGLGARVTKCMEGLWGVDVLTVDPSMNVHMAAEMMNADLVVTGQGRTVFEVAACGVPCLSIAANEREARHVRIPGVVYMGLHTLVSTGRISETVSRVLEDRALREDMGRTSRAQVDGKGLARIVHRLEGLLEGL